MYKLFLLPFFVVVMTLSLQAEKLDTNKSVQKDSNQSTLKTKRTQEQVKKQMEREKVYAQKQSFAQGDDYNLSAHEVDVNSLPDVPLIEPDYDFDITDVYRDDL